MAQSSLNPRLLSLIDYRLHLEGTTLAKIDGGDSLLSQGDKDYTGGATHCENQRWPLTPSTLVMKSGVPLEEQALSLPRVIE